MVFNTWKATVLYNTPVYILKYFNGLYRSQQDRFYNCEFSKVMAKYITKTPDAMNRTMPNHQLKS